MLVIGAVVGAVAGTGVIDVWVEVWVDVWSVGAVPLMLKRRSPLRLTPSLSIRVPVEYELACSLEFR